MGISGLKVVRDKLSVCWSDMLLLPEAELSLEFYLGFFLKYTVQIVLSNFHIL